MIEQNTFASKLPHLHLLKHPFYQAWMEGKLTKVVLQDYATQYHHHVSAFPRYISAIHSLCENSEARKILLENLNDEEGVNHGTSHPELWLRFGEGLGVERISVESTDPRPAIKNVVDTFMKFARSSFHEGLGALYAYESQVPEIAESKINGLKSNYGINDPRTLEFFEVHKTADIYHRDAVAKIINELNPKEKVEALAAAEVSAQALWDFLTDVHIEPTDVVSH